MYSFPHQPKEINTLQSKKSCAASTIYVKPQILFNNILEATLQEKPRKEDLRIERQEVYSKSKIIILLNMRPTAQQRHVSYLLMTQGSIL